MLSLLNAVIAAFIVAVIIAVIAYVISAVITADIVPVIVPVIDADISAFIAVEYGSCSYNQNSLSFSFQGAGYKRCQHGSCAERPGCHGPTQSGP